MRSQLVIDKWVLVDVILDHYLVDPSNYKRKRLCFDALQQVRKYKSDLIHRDEVDMILSSLDIWS